MQVITRETLNTLATINSPRLPGLIFDGGVWYRWTGIGWIDVSGKALPNPGEGADVAEDIYYALASIILRQAPYAISLAERQSIKARFFTHTYGAPDPELTLAIECLHPADREKLSVRVETKD